MLKCLIEYTYKIGWDMIKLLIIKTLEVLNFRFKGVSWVNMLYMSEQCYKSLTVRITDKWCKFHWKYSKV